MPPKGSLRLKVLINVYYFRKRQDRDGKTNKPQQFSS